MQTPDLDRSPPIRLMFPRKVCSTRPHAKDIGVWNYAKWDAQSVKKIRKNRPFGKCWQNLRIICDKKTCYFHFRRDQVLDRNRITVALRRLSRKHVTFKKRSGFEPKSDHCSPETSVKKTCYFHIWRDQILPNWDPLILTGFWRQKVSKSVSREANFRHWYLWHGAELKNLFVGTLIG